jgi:hypothetical protein
MCLDRFGNFALRAFHLCVKGAKLLGRLDQ